MRRGQKIRRGPFWVGSYRLERPKTKWNVYDPNDHFVEVFASFPEAENYAYAMQKRETLQ